jgi:adenosylhomocysteine nucleosidase
VTRVAIIAAMPGELKPLVRGWRRERRNGVDLWRWRFDQGEWIAACAGAGVEAATRAFAEVERAFKETEEADSPPRSQNRDLGHPGSVDFVISTGWAGALSEELEPGRAYFVSGVIDARSGERFRPAVWRGELWLITSPKVADAAEKQRLAAAYGAGLVDMEAAGIARLAQMRGIPFYCVKGISDGYTDQLPDFNRFISADGKFMLIRFILFALVRPWYWLALARMGENSRKAAESIKESILDFLDERAYIRERNDYPDLKP